jgi:hypothetical protein
MCRASSGFSARGVVRHFRGSHPVFFSADLAIPDGYRSSMFSVLRHFQSLDQFAYAIVVSQRAPAT